MPRRERAIGVVPVTPVPSGRDRSGAGGHEADGDGVDAVPEIRGGREALAAEARAAFSTGLRAAVALAALLHLVLAGIALRWLPRA